MKHYYSNNPLPSQDYLHLLGVALYVFNNTNTCVIETILKCSKDDYTWNDLIDRNSGNLRWPIKQTIAKSAPAIVAEFETLVDIRNRIAHSYQIRDDSGSPILAARDHKTGRVTKLTPAYLSDFISRNQKFVEALDSFASC